MAHVPARGNDSCCAPHSPVALRAAGLLCVFAGCADLLDIPSHPRLVDESVTSPVDAPGSEPSRPPPDTAPAAEPTLGASPPEAPTGPPALDTRDALTNHPTAVDAGAADA